MLETALLADVATLLIAGPAELVTRDKPSDAFDAVFCAVSLAAVAPFEAALAASEVVEAARLWTKNRDCRRTSRDTAGEAMIMEW